MTVVVTYNIRLYDYIWNRKQLDLQNINYSITKNPPKQLIIFWNNVKRMIYDIMSPYEATGNHFHILTTPAAGMVWNTVKPKKKL